MIGSTSMNRAVFLDRDGVLNRARVVAGKSYPPVTVDAFELLEGVSEACERLKAKGLQLIVVTNQPDVATGIQRRSVVDAMHRKLFEWLPIDDIFTCYHIESDDCSCRKPRPGMLLAAATKHAINLKMSYLVGDRWRDIEAGQTVGCQTYFIDYDYDERRPNGHYTRVGGLLEASQRICVGGRDNP